MFDWYYNNKKGCVIKLLVWKRRYMHRYLLRIIYTILYNTGCTNPILTLITSVLFYIMCILYNIIQLSNRNLNHLALVFIDFFFQLSKCRTYTYGLFLNMLPLVNISPLVGARSKRRYTSKIIQH